MKRFFLFALVLGVLAGQASADMYLRLDDGTTTLTIGDGDALDANAEVGAITYIGSIGSWVTNVTTGLSKPLLGNANRAQMDLNSVDVSSQEGGTLTIMLTDTGFTLPTEVGEDAWLISSIGGTTVGTVVLEQILDRKNNEFAVGSSDMVSLFLGPFSPTAFSGETSTSAPVTGPFSITEVATIVHNGAGSTSFDAVSEVVPVPGAVLLGVLGLSVAGARLRKRS